MLLLPWHLSGPTKIDNHTGLQAYPDNATTIVNFRRLIIAQLTTMKNEGSKTLAQQLARYKIYFRKKASIISITEEMV